MSVSLKRLFSVSIFNFSHFANLQDCSLHCEASFNWRPISYRQLLNVSASRENLLCAQWYAFWWTIS